MRIHSKIIPSFILFQTKNQCQRRRKIKSDWLNQTIRLDARTYGGSQKKISLFKVESFL
jgi:hypothetical protein